MKKKLWTLVSVCLLVFCLAGCAKTDPTTIDYNGFSYENLEMNCQQMAQILELSDTEFWESYLLTISEKNNKLDYDMVRSWIDAREGEGEFEKFGDFTVTKADDTLTTDQIIECENRDLKMTFVYDYDTMELQSITTDKVYTLGETMSKAGMNTLMGMGIVFVILILISVIIYCFRIIPYLQNRKKKNAANKSGDKVVEQIVQREEQLQDDLELVAVIAAAIAAATGSSTDDFVVRSIKRR